MTPHRDPMVAALLDAAPDAIVAVDAEGHIVLVNAECERLFGYARDDLVGQPVEMLVPDVARDVHRTHRSSYVASPKRRPMGAGLDLAARRADGSTFPVDVSLSYIDTERGLIVAAAVRDVTERARADAKFRGLLDAAPDAMVCVDVEGRIVLVNAQAEHLFGYERDELIGESVELLVPESARPAHRHHHVRYYEHPVTRPMGGGMTFAGRRRDGSEFPAEISLSAFETEDGLWVSAAVRDITGRLEAEAERDRLRAEAERERQQRHLQQSQRLESLGQLAGGVAHDFNNLLAVILNYATFVAEDIGSATAAATSPSARWTNVLADVTQIQRAAERASRLTHQLLAFARREVVQPIVLNLNEVVEDVQELLTRTIGEHVRLVTQLAPDLWPVMADVGGVEQVLVNLAVNARDAMPDGGTLVIRTSNVVADETYGGAITAARAGRYVALDVSDTGTGMEPDVRDRVFEPFFTTKPQGQGTGLGLATVHGIVHQAGGYTRIYSEVGLGTTVVVMLPAHHVGTVAPAAGSDAADRPPQRAVVLVVEDEDAMREVTRRILARNGYDVLTAARGDEAIEIARLRDDIDLLLSDVVMPGMLGKEVAERVTAIRPSIRVLYMSGYAQPVLGAKGTLDEGVELVQKPFSEAVLLSRVRHVLEGDR